MISGSAKLRAAQAEGKDEVDNLQDQEEELLRRALVRLSGNVLGLVFGVLLGLTIFAATNWLILKGGPVVGPHLSLLSQFFIGYTVTFAGSLVGMLYGFVGGYLAGFFIAWVYNLVASHLNN